MTILKLNPRNSHLGVQLMSFDITSILLFFGAKPFSISSSVDEPFFDPFFDEPVVGPKDLDKKSINLNRKKS